MPKTKAEEKLQKAVDRLRELSDKKELSEDESTELESTMAKAKSLRDGIVRDRTIDEFTRTISEDVDPGKAAAAAQPKAVKIGRTQEGVNVYADAKEFAETVKVWKDGQGKERQWGFDVRYKTDADNSVTEIGAGAETLFGTAVGNEYGGVVQPFYYPGIIEPPTRPPLIADLFAQGATDSNLIRLVKETTTSNSAGPTAEGAAYGAVKIEVSPYDWPVKDITALLPVSEDILMDIPAMSSYLSMRLAKFVQLAEEQELVTGDGTGNHLEGLQHTVGRTTKLQGSDDIDTAVMKLNAAVYAASFMDPQWVAMSPTTWASYVTLRTNLNGGLGQFLAGSPSLAAVRQIWGLPITVTPVIPDGRIFVGNSAAGMIFRHGGLRVESSTGYGTFFGEGLVAIRGKVRTAFAMFRPQAIGELLLGS